MGAPELIILLYVAAFAAWGYRAGAKRNIGQTAGLFLGLFLNFVGIIIVYCSKRMDDQPYYSPEPVTDQLKKYKDLLDSGAINEAEYNIQKAKLLNT
ncbi:MAG TPA: SHOCT domain-containing protein [Mucilaginibacter sp.]|jgi:hypothetical protein